MTADKLPAYNLRYIARVRRAAAKSRDLLPLLGAPLENTDLPVLIDVYKKLVDRSVSDSVYLRSLMFYVGHVATSNLFSLIGWRLAGNRQFLQTGGVLRPWMGQSAPEWVPSQIVEVTSSQQDRELCHVRLNLVAGTPCGLIAEKKWSPRFVGFLANKHLGFASPRRSEHCHYVHPSQITRLFLYCLISPERSTRTVPGFEQIRVPPAFRRENRQLLLKRDRVGYKCEFGYSHPCYRCHVGATDCVCATHPATYVRAHCISCQDLGWFDPRSGSGYCLKCARQRKV